MLKSRIETHRDENSPSEWHQFLYGDYEPYVEVIEDTVKFPTIRRVFAQTIAMDLVSVRPMDPPRDWMERRIEQMTLQYIYDETPTLWQRIRTAIINFFTFIKWN